MFPPSSASRFLRRRRRPPCEVTSTSCSVGNPIATSCVDGKDEATGCGLLPSRVDRPILCLLNIVKQLIASPKRQPGNLWSFDFFLTIARTRTRKRTHTHTQMRHHDHTRPHVLRVSKIGDLEGRFPPTEHPNARRGLRCLSAWMRFVRVPRWTRSRLVAETSEEGTGLGMTGWVDSCDML